VYVFVSPSFAVTGALVMATVGAELATATESLAVVPSKRPSFGVASTEIVSPLLPFPATERSNVSVADALVFDGDVNVRFVTPFTFQTNVTVVASLSGSLFDAVAVNVWFVVGGSGVMFTLAVGTRSHVTVGSVDVDAVLLLVAVSCAAPAGIDATTLPRVAIPVTATL